MSTARDLTLSPGCWPCKIQSKTKMTENMFNPEKVVFAYNEIAEPCDVIASSRVMFFFSYKTSGQSTAVIVGKCCSINVAYTKHN